MSIKHQFLIVGNSNLDEIKSVILDTSGVRRVESVTHELGQVVAFRFPVQLDHADMARLLDEQEIPYDGVTDDSASQYALLFAI